jgi:hypothetical protein
MTSIPSSTPDTTRNDLAGIVERDEASGSIHATPSITTAGTHDAYAPADRRVLLGLLREAREALRDTKSALVLTVTAVPESDRPHWCRFVGGRHDATCSGMLVIQDNARALLELLSVLDDTNPERPMSLRRYSPMKASAGTRWDPAIVAGVNHA